MTMPSDAQIFAPHQTFAPQVHATRSVCRPERSRHSASSGNCLTVTAHFGQVCVIDKPSLQDTRP